MRNIFNPSNPSNPLEEYDIKTLEVRIKAIDEILLTANETKNTMLAAGIDAKTNRNNPEGNRLINTANENYRNISTPLISEKNNILNEITRKKQIKI